MFKLAVTALQQLQIINPRSIINAIIFESTAVLELASIEIDHIAQPYHLPSLCKSVPDAQAMDAGWATCSSRYEPLFYKVIRLAEPLGLTKLPLVGRRRLPTPTATMQPHLYLTATTFFHYNSAYTCCCRI